MNNSRLISNNLEQYKVFYSIAKSGSMLKASEQLYITQPAVSRAIRQLEISLGCPLFFRTSKGVKLTREGEIMLSHIEQAFNFIQTAERKISEMKDLLCGEIRIGVSDTLCKHYLIPYLKLFNTYHPEVKINVICPTTPGIIHSLLAGKIDFGIVNMPYMDERIVFKHVMQIQDCFVAGEKYRHMSSRPYPLSEIAAYPLLMLEKSSNSRLYMDEYFRENSVDAAPALELGNIDLLVQFARNDFGIACVFRNFIQDDLAQGGLHEVKPVERIPPRSVSAAWLKDMPLPAAAREMIGYLDYNETSDI